MRQHTPFDPSSKSAIHCCSLVSIFLTSVVEDDSGDVIFASELDFDYKQALVTTIVYNAATNATTIDEDTIGAPFVVGIVNAIG